MFLVYIDDSKDLPGNLCVYSALMIPAAEWRKAFEQIKGFRRQLKRSDGIFVKKEFHATEFIRGKGRISEDTVSKWRRAQVFRDTLTMIASLPGARLINAAFPMHDEERAFERLLNRINVNVTKSDPPSYALLICDEGNEGAFTGMVRRMGVHNHIPSRFGKWDSTGKSTMNIPISRIIEDPVFKRSDHSYFIQMADFCAYALLRRERPTPHITKYGLHNAFDVLKPILVTQANHRDAEGIIRPHP